MTAPATTRRAGPFNGNGAATSFPFTFKVFAASDIAVVKTSTAGVESTLALGSGYSVALNVDQDASPGGNITYPVSGSALAVGEKLTVIGALPYDQTADLPTGGSYRAVVVENALDRTVFQVQQLVERLDRTLTLPTSATAATGLPAPEAFKVLGWNSTGTALINTPAGAPSGTEALVLARLSSITAAAVNVIDYGAVLDGVTDDYAALVAAHTALPSTGGTIIIPSSAAGMKLGTTFAPSKPTRVQPGALMITGPTAGFIFDLSANGSSFAGGGRGATKLKLSTPAVTPVMPVVTVTLTAGVVTGYVIVSPGANLTTTPIVEVGASPTQADAALIATISGGVLTGIVILVPGSGYVTAPAISFIGGGAGAIKSNEIQGSSISGVTIDTNNIPNAVGVYHYGGWYADMWGIDVMASTSHASSIGLVIDSHTLGIPGPTGSFGGAYVNRYSNIYAAAVAVIGHDTSTATTLQFDTLDAARVYLHAAVAVTMVNPVIQSNAGYMLDLVNVDGLSVLGGDIEGSAGMLRVRGSCNNLRIKGPLAYSMTGALYYGVLGVGWDLDIAKTTSTREQFKSGGGGSAGVAYQNTGWTAQHRFGMPYSGGTLVMASNIKLLTATTGTLDDITLPGIVVQMNTGGQYMLQYATAGANPRTLVDIAQFDSGGLKMTNLPAANPGAGTKRFWYDGADGNRVKFAP